MRNHITNENRSRTTIISIGEKGAAALARPFPDILKECINEFSAPINFYVTL